MKPIPFKQQNTIFAENQSEYMPLPAHVTNDHNRQVTSCWRLSWKELFKLIFTRQVYVSVYTFGYPLQPQYLTIDVEEVIPDETSET